MDDDALSTTATAAVGLAGVVAFRDWVTATPNVGWLVVAASVGLLVLSGATVAFPNATVLNRSISTGGLPRWLSLLVLALAGTGLLLTILTA